MQIKQTTRNICFIITALNFACDSADSNSENSISQNIEIQKTITLGGSSNESGQCVVDTPDGGYVVLGYTQSMDGDVVNKIDSSYDFWLLKFNAAGVQQWQNIYGGSDDDRAQEVITTVDGGFAIIGSSKSIDGDVSENSGSSDFWVLKVNDLGNIEWERSFGYSGVDNGLSVLQTQDQGFLISGVLDVTSSNGEGNTNRIGSSRHAGGDYWILKLNEMGVLQWSRLFGGTYTDTPHAINETQDGDFIIVGSSDSIDLDISNSKGSYDYWVLKLSGAGDLIWEKSFGGSEIDEAKAMAPAIDGDFLIVGDSRSQDSDVSTNYGAADVWIIKLNTDGELVWEKSFGGSNFDGVQGIHPVQNGGFIIAGNSRSSDIDLSENKGENDAWLFKISDHGSLEWQTSVGGSNIELLMDVVELENGNIISVGNASSSDFDILENNGFSDLLIIEAMP